jgi:RNA polymerase-binding transcription factor DksA
VTTIDTAEFRTLLEAERTRLVHAVGFLHLESPGNGEDELGGGTDNHLGDVATLTFERELDEGLEQGAQYTLDAIEAALARIDAGTYGTCEVCGRPIGVERLRAIPWASLCIDDQRRSG